MKQKNFTILAVAGLLVAFCAFVGAGSDVPSPPPDVLESILRRMEKRLDAVKDFQCLYVSFAVKEARRKDTLLKYFYKKPGWIRAEIVEGEHKGTILIARDGYVRAKPAGLLSLFVFTFPAGHPRVTDIRGNTLEETSWEHFVAEHIRNIRRMTLQSLRREALDGREALVFEIASRDPAQTRGVAREILWVCAAEDILLRFEMYDAEDRLVQMSQFSDIILNPGLPDSLFVRFRGT